MLREVTFNDWYTAIIIVSLALIVSAKLLDPNRFVLFMKLIGNSNYLRIYFKDNSFFDSFNLLLFVNFCINASLTGIITYSTYYGFNIDLSCIDIITIIAVLLIGLVTKSLLELTTGFVFDIRNICNSYVFQKISVLNFLGVFLLPLNALLIFNPTNQSLLLALTLIISGLIILIGLFKTIKSYQKLLINNFFYFILYLCTLEFGPYIILCKLFSYEIN